MAVGFFSVCFLLTFLAHVFSQGLSSTREERAAVEGSGMGFLDTFNDYGIDDEDHEFGSTTIVSRCSFVHYTRS